MKARRLLQPDDLFRLKTPYDPQISPDGRFVAYVVGETRREEDSTRANIWLAPVEGGTPRRLTNGPRSDHSPRWSPDGQHIAFVSNRLEGKPPQIWCIPIDGGEAVQITALPSGVTGAPIWSPDGKRIAFVSRVVANADDPNRARRPRVVRRLRYQLNGAGYIGDSYWHVFVAPVSLNGAPSEARQVTTGNWHHFHPAWSPDGRQLALVTTRRPDWDLEWIWDVYILPSDGDGTEMRKLTRSEGVALGPSWSPDGKQIAYYDNQCTSTGSTKDYHVWVAPVDGGPARDLTGSLDRGAMAFEPPSSVTPPVWLADGRSLAWLLFDAGQTKIGVVDGDGRPPRVAFAGPPTPLAFSVADDGDWIAILGGTPTAPGDVYVVRFAGATTGQGLGGVPHESTSVGGAIESSPDPRGSGAGGGIRQLTDVNAEVLATVAMRAPETFVVESPDGLRIESQLWLPPDFTSTSGPIPTLLHFHGGPHGATGTHFSFPFQLLAGGGYAVVSANFRGSAGYGTAFADRILGNWGPGELEDSLLALDALIARGVADPNRLGVYGSSYGGFMTNYAITHSDRFHAAATIATISSLETLSYLTDQWESIDWDNGGPPWERAEYYRAHSPLSHVSRIETPLLILHGEADNTCTIAEAEQLFVALRKLRRSVELVRYPGESHGLVSSGRPSTRLDIYERLLDWFNRHLRAESGT